VKFIFTVRQPTNPLLRGCIGVLRSSYPYWRLGEAFFGVTTEAYATRAVTTEFCEAHVPFDTWAKPKSFLLYFLLFRQKKGTKENLSGDNKTAKNFLETAALVKLVASDVGLSFVRPSSEAATMKQIPRFLGQYLRNRFSYSFLDAVFCDAGFNAPAEVKLCCLRRKCKQVHWKCSKMCHI
jgi:hypothetical protein